MTLGLFDQAYHSMVVPYNDEETPVKLTGVKMLPIMTFNGKPMNESLDIMAKLDTQNRLKIADLQHSENMKPFNELLNKLGANVHNLAMPYWIYTPEFDEKSREYFQQKKEKKRGPFKNLVKNRAAFEDAMLRDLEMLDLRPFYKSDTFSLYDIMLASHIWGLYVVPEFRFPENVHNYLQKVKELCRFNYHQDFWK
jgi:glutaredoxin 2